jgi:SPP1 family predicted phage head-tail adaptor
VLNVKLDRRISIDRRVGTQDATFGAATPSWVLLATVWAEVKATAPSRSEAVRMGLETARNQSRVRIRWRDDVDSTMRVRFGSRILQIVGGPAELGRREFLEMVCEENSTNGGT